MKTTLKKIMSLAFVAALVASCGDDDNNAPSSTFVLVPSAFQGDINGVAKWKDLFTLFEGK